MSVSTFFLLITRFFCHSEPTGEESKKKGDFGDISPLTQYDKGG
ncbi:hypothetical protein ACRE1S_04180 [Helicobacter himalayensis]